MKSNKPITKTIQIPLTYNEDGSVATFENKEILLDRLCCNVCLSPISSGGIIKNSVVLTVKRNSPDGYIDIEPIKTYIFSDVANCGNSDILKVFDGIEVLLTELFNKEGL